MQRQHGSRIAGGRRDREGHGHAGRRADGAGVGAEDRRRRGFVGRGAAHHQRVGLRAARRHGPGGHAHGIGAGFVRRELDQFHVVRGVLARTAVRVVRGAAGLDHREVQVVDELLAGADRAPVVGIGQHDDVLVGGTGRHGIGERVGLPGGQAVGVEEVHELVGGRLQGGVEIHVAPALGLFGPGEDFLLGAGEVLARGHVARAGEQQRLQQRRAGIGDAARRRDPLPGQTCRAGHQRRRHARAAHVEIVGVGPDAPPRVRGPA